MLPQDKSAAVFRGLREGLGATAIDEIRLAPKGLSSDAVVRIVVEGSPYLLRIMTRIDERMDPGRIFACMSAAAEAGLAPRVRYANAEDGISITDWVEAVPFPATEALVRLPGTLRMLHALPLFPKTFNYGTAHNGFIWRFRATGLLPKDEVEEIFARYEQVCASYPRLDSDMVSCHNDLKPENILFDGQRVWLAGWQAAFVNDRYFDLAVAANFLVSSDADELVFLGNYFSQPPDDYQRARFFLMRQVAHMLSATVFLMLGSGGKSVAKSGNLPSFAEFHQQIWDGKVDLADNELKIAYGRVHWEELSRNLRQKRFEEAIRVVSERNPGPQTASLLLPSAP